MPHGRDAEAVACSRHAADISAFRSPASELVPLPASTVKAIGDMRFA